MGSKRATYQYRGDDHGFVVQTLDNLGVLLAVRPREVHPRRRVPRPDLPQSVPRQVDDIQDKVGPESLIVELDGPRQPPHLHLEHQGSMRLAVWHAVGCGCGCSCGCGASSAWAPQLCGSAALRTAAES